ncbi:MAG: TolB family protein [Nitrospirota bacterium]
MKTSMMRLRTNVAFSIGISLLSLYSSVNAVADELLVNQTRIISSFAGQIPQAPRVSPDGREIVYENYAKEKVTLWHASAEGKGAHCLTCEGVVGSLNHENAFWHPSGNYIIFNEVPVGNVKKGGVHVASLKNGKITQVVKVAEGARPQFSRPNGHVIFYEATRQVDQSRVYDRIDNVLAYQIVGKNPLSPLENMQLELRGPIQRINEEAEISHPALAPDGATIVFAARSTVIKMPGQVVLNDIDRQKIYKLWQALKDVDGKKLDRELARFGAYNKQIPQDYPEDYEDSEGGTVPPPRAVQIEYPENDAFKIIMSDEAFLSQPTIVSGYTRRHFYLAYVLGLVQKDARSDQAVQEMIFPRLWVTNVFGAPIVPLVKDISSTPLPQKWPTVSHDGQFVVFEAGHYTNRHIYLAMKKKEGLLDKAVKKIGINTEQQWIDKAVKITERGTYNSSPEIDPTGQWLYFESNRDGAKAIWRAKLNWPEINKRLGL